jgi:hypothetical protein
MLTPPAALSPQPDLTPLDAFPWLVPSATAAPAASKAGRSARPTDTKLLLHAGIAMAFAALCGGAYYLAGGSAQDPAPLVEHTRLAQAVALPAAAAATEIGQAEMAASAQAPQAPVTQQDLPARAPSAPAHHIARMPAPAPRIEPSPLDAEPIATVPASSIAAAPPAGADSPATAASLREFRLAVDQGRDAVRAVIRLGKSQRPKRDASADEITRYRLRQQNAEAAKTYRSYLDTLARTVRAAKSETVTRQSLDRARQTLGYLATMQADSKASLR